MAEVSCFTSPDDSLAQWPHRMYFLSPPGSSSSPRSTYGFEVCPEFEFEASATRIQNPKEEAGESGAGAGAGSPSSRALACMPEFSTLPVLLLTTTEAAVAAPKSDELEEGFALFISQSGSKSGSISSGGVSDLRVSGRADESETLQQLLQLLSTARRAAPSSYSTAISAAALLRPGSSAAAPSAGPWQHLSACGPPPPEPAVGVAVTTGAAAAAGGNLVGASNPAETASAADTDATGTLTVATLEGVHPGTATRTGRHRHHHGTKHLTVVPSSPAKAFILPAPMPRASPPACCSHPQAAPPALAPRWTRGPSERCCRPCGR